MNPEFASVFSRLRGILERHAGDFKVSADKPGHYCLDVAHSPKLKKGFPVAWVKINKAYVSFHFIPVCLFPIMAAGMSPELKARMQGKTCFNFKVADEALFNELERLTKEGFEQGRDAKFL